MQHEAPQQRAHVTALAHPRGRARLPGGGRVGAAHPRGPHDLPRLVRQFATEDPSRLDAQGRYVGDGSHGIGRVSAGGLLAALEAGRAVRLGRSRLRRGPPGVDAARPPAGRSAQRSTRTGPQFGPDDSALPDPGRIRGRDVQPDGALGHAHRLGPGRDGRLPRSDGGSGQAQRTVRGGVHGRDQAVSPPARLPGVDAFGRAGLEAGAA